MPLSIGNACKTSKKTLEIRLERIPAPPSFVNFAVKSSSLIAPRLKGFAFFLAFSLKKTFQSVDKNKINAV